MPAVAIILFALIACMLSFLIMVLWAPEPEGIEKKHGLGFYISLPTLALWFLIFAATPTTYSLEIFKSVTVDGRDGFFDARGEFRSLNGMFGKRFEPGTTIEGKTEIPRFGLIWTEATSYSVKETNGTGND